MLAALLAMAFMLVVACVYWTTGAAHRLLKASVIFAAMISIAGWWSIDCVLAFVVAPQVGPMAQIDLIDLHAFGFDRSPTGKLALYVLAHAIGLVPRLVRRVVPA